MNALAYTTFIVCPPAFLNAADGTSRLIFIFYFVVCFFICVVGIKIHIFVFSFYSLHLFAVAACLHLLSDAIHNFFLFILISSSIFFRVVLFIFYNFSSLFLISFFFKGLKLMRIDVISLYSEIIMNTSCKELTINITSLLITFRQTLITLLVW